MQWLSTGFISTACSNASWKAVGTAHSKSLHLPKIVLGSCSISSSYCDLVWKCQEMQYCYFHQPVLKSQEGQFVWGRSAVSQPHPLLRPRGCRAHCGELRGDTPTFSSLNRGSFSWQLWEGKQDSGRQESFRSFPALLLLTGGVLVSWSLGRTIVACGCPPPSPAPCHCRSALS